MLRRVLISSVFIMIVHLQNLGAQSFRLFATEVKNEYPSVVYDFLERYLYELDSLQRKGIDTRQRIADDKVFFLYGSVISANDITPDIGFTMDIMEGKSYKVSWADSTGNMILSLTFPMQYELILGKPKNIIESELKSELMKSPEYVLSRNVPDELEVIEDSCYRTKYSSHYYLESLTTATYYTKDSTGTYRPTYNERDKWHSAANLLQGEIRDISGYTLFVKQNLYGFKYDTYTVPLNKWLGYCKEMKMTTYFAVEEEHEDGLKVLVIAQSPDLGFNHILSLIIPEDFVCNKRSVLKASLNAYVPTQNVKDLYQQYVEKPKKNYE